MAVIPKAAAVLGVLGMLGMAGMLVFGSESAGNFGLNSNEGERSKSENSDSYLQKFAHPKPKKKTLQGCTMLAGLGRRPLFPARSVGPCVTFDVGAR